jgi:hypothetical protein
MTNENAKQLTPPDTTLREHFEAKKKELAIKLPIVTEILEQTPSDTLDMKMSDFVKIIRQI